MKLISTLSAPLVVSTTKSHTAKGMFILNLNNYRNAPFMKLNAAKIAYKLSMTEQIQALPVMDKLRVRYTMYPKTHRLTDTANVCSIHEKFFMDALVTLGKLPEDNYKHCLESAYIFGSVDKSNPRVDIELYEVQG